MSNEYQTIPMDVDGWDEVDTLVHDYIGTFTEDFGPWKKGEALDITVDYGRGIITEYDKSRKSSVIKKQFLFKLVER